MELPDDEQRRLHEIEQQLASDSPWLAEQFSGERPFTSSRRATASILTAVPLGLAMAVIGTATGSAVLIACGLILAVALPTVIILRRLLSFGRR